MPMIDTALQYLYDFIAIYWQQLIMIILAIAAIGGVTLSYIFRPTKIDVERKHSEDLKELIQRWINDIEVLTIKEIGDIRHHKAEFLQMSVEKERLFSDLKNHIPQGLRPFQLWEDFKSDYTSFENKCYNLYNNIRMQAVEKTGLELEENSQKKERICLNFMSTIYAELVNLASGGKEVYSNIQYKVKCDKEGKWDLNIPTERLACSAEKEGENRMIQVGEVHKSMLNMLPKSVHLQTAKEILKDKRKLEESKEKVIIELTDIRYTPLLPRKCKYIKWSFPGILSGLAGFFHRKKR